MIPTISQRNRNYRLGEHLPRNLSKIPSYNVSMKEFVKFTNFQGIGLIKTLYLSAIVFITAFSLLIIMFDWINGDATRIILGLVFTSIFWFVSLILLRVCAECIVSLISISHLLPILKQSMRSYKRTLANSSILKVMSNPNSPNLTRIKREEWKEDPNLDIHQDYNLEKEYDPPKQFDNQNNEIDNDDDMKDIQVMNPKRDNQDMDDMDDMDGIEVIHMEHDDDNEEDDNKDSSVDIDPNEWNPYKDTTSEDSEDNVPNQQD